MFNKEQKNEETPKKKSSGLKSIKALRDFSFQFDGKIYDLKEGESYEVPAILLDNLKTEKVTK